MAIVSKSLFALALALFIFISITQAYQQNPQGLDVSAVKPDGVGGASMDCKAQCARRCRLSSRQNLCHRACGTCCARCSCVPPGTSGNTDSCPCYAKMTTHGGRKKCP